MVSKIVSVFWSFNSKFNMLNLLPNKPLDSKLVIGLVLKIYISAMDLGLVNI